MLVLYKEDWCAYCQAFLPVWETLQQTYTHEERTLQQARDHGYTTIPTIVWEKGLVRHKFPGGQKERTQQNIEKWIASIKPTKRVSWK
jgi:thiol-disulfide isomerase/thioredoxin